MFKFLRNFSLKADTSDIAEGVTQLTKTKRVRKVIGLIIVAGVVLTLSIALLTGQITFEQFMQGTNDVMP